ncbi:MAG: single-stranded-DNA-specific exonuclease RecJ [Chlorobi bacterium]|nr:single-stranded-DNA-specific exonuclease RecJ [Chlorobiota bacterium]
MEKRWIIKEPGNKKDVKHLSEVLNIDKSLSNLLVQRGIHDFESAKSFFRPELSQLHDPFLMKNMDLAVNRITDAVKNKEKILIYGDYDVDGTTSVAMTYLFFKDYIDIIDYYIPDRYEEGYGISFKGIDYAEENGFTLIIALDCGIKAIDKIDYANEKNIDFIICDHHNPDEKIPNAIAVLDPKQPDCTYPFKDLSGCGVGFKLIQAYAGQNSIEEDKVFNLLDFVAVSIASDIVTIIDENRVLAFYGLQKLNKNPSAGLKSIIEFAGINEQNIDITSVVFKIGPRINAAGRVESGKKAVELLVSSEKKDVFELTEHININNDTRKNLDRSITLEAIKMIEEDKDLQGRKSTVLYNPEWHKGVIGIVASRLIEAHYRPTVVLTKSNGFATGSARSVLGFDLYRAIEKCSYLLETFGGHKYAAGLTLKEENVEAFREQFDQVATEMLTHEQLIPQIEIDSQIEFSEIDAKFFRILNQFEPFGPGNMKPVFLTQNVLDTGNSKLVGNDHKHIKMALYQEGWNGKFSAVGFNLGHCFSIVKSKKTFDICYTVEENRFKGNINLQLNIKDIKEHH